MSEQIKHECGIALVKLKKPAAYYKEKFGTEFYGLQKLKILLEKQRNRGQDGAGMAIINSRAEAGKEYLDITKSIEKDPIADLFKQLNEKSKNKNKVIAEGLHGDTFLGHLRYGTYNSYGIENVHPFARTNSWRSKTIIAAGNFNLTNIDELKDKLIALGQHPRESVDTVIVLEKISHYLNQEVEDVFAQQKDQLSGLELSHYIEKNINLLRVIRKCFKHFDGGYTIGAVTGFGSAFVARDPNGIRPAYYFENEEVIAAASERAALAIAFKVPYEEIKEIPNGNVLIISSEGHTELHRYIEEKEKTSCSFERIYFSRASDPAIYKERKKLGAALAAQLLEQLGNSISDVVFSYVPNTSEVAFYGLIEELFRITKQVPRIEKLLWKDTKARTFITQGNDREELVNMVYEPTSDMITPNDKIVIIDDSIVRGTTLRESLLEILNDMNPKEVIIASTAPIIKYPDCYGINMSNFTEFLAFQAAVNHYRKSENQDIYESLQVKIEEELSTEEKQKLLINFYGLIDDKILIDEMIASIKPSSFKSKLSLVFQSTEALNAAIPGHTGTWYFDGKYPTVGGINLIYSGFKDYFTEHSSSF